MRAMDSEISVRDSICPLDCADTCSLSVEVKDGEVHKIRGSHANPFTAGKVCSKVTTGFPAQVHGSNRLTTPLRLCGPKGSGHYEAISWDSALKEIHQRYQAIIAEHGTQAIVPLSYGGPMGLLAGGSMDKRFFNRLGATQVDASPLCAGVSGAAYESVFGDTGGISYEELSESKLIVVWGNNITVGNLHLTKVLRKARKSGAKLVVVDPKRIRIAEEADLHLPILPGTDVVLAYAVAAELERRGALDDAFIAEHVHGAEVYLERAAEFSLSDAASICGIEVKDIEAFVALWANMRPAAISIGVAPERNRNGGGGIRAAFALLVLTGNIGMRGAGVCDVSGFFPIRRDVLEQRSLIPQGTPEISVLDIPDLILNPGDGTPIKSVFIYNHNPVAVHPRQVRMQQALLSEGLYVVGSDITMTDSMAYADIILPAASHFEYGDLYKAYGHSYLQRSEAVIEPVGEALPNTEIFRRLALKFGFQEECFSHTDEELMNMAVEQEVPALGGKLATDIPIGGAVDMTVANRNSLLRDAVPDTPSGKIELFSETLERECGEGLPRYRSLESACRFVLVSPSSAERTNSTFGGVDAHDRDMVVEMNPGDAASLGLSDGQQVRIFNEQGNVIMPVAVSDKIRSSTLYVPKGAWLKSSRTGQTVNALIPGHKADIAGGACYNDATVNVEAFSFDSV
ncbi:MAG: anaerobic selenocysteine-containing dehydrogenase [Halioglobus sp.]|jgi:anaerobic selenocysteine-containing dehydrogenase